MPSYLIYRHGSNKANQSMTLTACVGSEEAASRAAAVAQAKERITCYTNQRLEARPASRCSEADREEAWLADEAAAIA